MWSTSYPGPPHSVAYAIPGPVGGLPSEARRTRRGGAAGGRRGDGGAVRGSPEWPDQLPRISVRSNFREIKHAYERNPWAIGAKITMILLDARKRRRSETKSTSHRHHKAAGLACSHTHSL